MKGSKTPSTTEEAVYASYVTTMNYAETARRFDMPRRTVVNVVKRLAGDDLAEVRLAMRADLASEGGGLGEGREVDRDRNFPPIWAPRDPARALKLRARRANLHVSLAFWNHRPMLADVSEPEIHVHVNVPPRPEAPLEGESHAGTAVPNSCNPAT